MNTTKAVYVAFHKPSGKWNVTVTETNHTPDGKTRTSKSLGYFASEAEAHHERAEHMKLLGLVEKPSARPAEPKRCVQTIFLLVRKERVAAGYAATSNWEGVYENWIAPHPVSLKPIEDVTRKELQQWSNWVQTEPSKRKHRPLDRQSVINVHAVMSTLFAYAARRTWIDTNIAASLELAPKVRGADKERNAFTEKEFIKLISDSDIPLKHRLLFRLAGYSGLRASEIEKCKVSDLHLNEPVPFYLMPKQKNGERRMRFPLTSEAVGAIKEILALRRHGGDVWLFPSETGDQHKGSWASEVQRAIARLGGMKGRIPGAPFDFHSLRRTFASMMSDGTIGAELSADDRRLLMRHKDVRTTQRYDKADETKRFAAIAKIDGKSAVQNAAPCSTEILQNGPDSVVVH